MFIMEIVLMTLCAMALVLVGAFVSGGRAFPAFPDRPEEPQARQGQEDTLSADLAALLGYQLGGDDAHGEEKDG